MRVLNTSLALAAVALSQETAGIKLDHLAVADVMASITGANEANKTFAAAAVDVAANTATTAAQAYTTGAKCTLTTTDTLPAGLALLTDYYLIVVSTTVVKFASSQVNALAGTAIDITDQGLGVHTIAITTALAGTVKLQKNDEPADATAVWKDITSSSQAFAAAGTLNWTLVDIGYREIRAVVAVTSGTVAAAVRINAKGV